MRDHPCPHQHHPAGTGSGGGVLVLVAVLALLVVAAPHVHTLQPLVDQLRQAGPLGSLARPTLPRGISGGGVCPVRGRVRIGQGWGAPRDGGRRRHQGIDLLAAAGTPLVAVADGHISPASNVERGRGGDHALAARPSWHQLLLRPQPAQPRPPRAAGPRRAGDRPSGRHWQRPRRPATPPLPAPPRRRPAG
jgi:hypothetical protein